MALKRENLLKFSRLTELAITMIDDDSSPGEDGTEVKILQLAKPVTAVGSIPTGNGQEMKVSGQSVYVAGDNIDELLKDLTEEDGILVYKGPMHLDVSKPSGRTDSTGKFVVTKPAKIWLTKTKFSRGGATLRSKQTENLNDLVNKMFAGGVVNLSVTEGADGEGGAPKNDDQAKGETKGATKEAEATVVPGNKK